MGLQVWGRQWSAGLGSVALGGAIAAATLCLGQQPAQAQAAFGSYIGVGGSVGLTSDNTGAGSSFSGVISGRYRFLETPMSLRAQAFVGGGTFAFVPTVSYDYPLNWNTDIYIGAGVSIAGGSGTPSSVGDQTAFVIQPGIDYALPNSRLVLFGNAIIGFGAFRNGSGSPAVAIQGGVGYQF